MVGRILRVGDGRDILVAKYEIEKEDVFHVKNLYEWMHEWLVEQGWSDTDPVGGENFEHYYSERVHQSGMREHRIWWRVKKIPGNNQYFRYVMLINFRNLAAKKVEIVHQGKKVGTWRGDLTLEVEAWLQLDYQDKWRNHWLLGRLENLYRTRIYKDRIEQHKENLWREAYTLAAWIKQFLKMKTPFEQPKEFHPVGGVEGNPPIKRP